MMMYIPGISKRDVNWVFEHDSELFYMHPTNIKYAKHYKKRKWITHDGRVIKISKMSDVHLINCLAMIKRDLENTGHKPGDYLVYRNLIEEFRERVFADDER